MASLFPAQTPFGFNIFPSWRRDPTRTTFSSFLRFLYHTQRRPTVGTIPLVGWSARRRDLYLTTHNTYDRKTSMPPAGFEPAISAGVRQQTYALDRAATGTGIWLLFCFLFTRPCLKDSQFLVLCCFRQMKSLMQFIKK